MKRHPRRSRAGHRTHLTQAKPFISVLEFAMSSFAIYIIGTIILIAGIVYICHLAHIPQQWIIGLTILMLGAGIMGAVNSTKQKDKS
jgi:general stress protein CsbA